MPTQRASQVTDDTAGGSSRAVKTRGSQPSAKVCPAKRHPEGPKPCERGRFAVGLVVLQGCDNRSDATYTVFERQGAILHTEAALWELDG